MAQLAAAALVAGTVLQAKGTIDEGNAANKQAKYEAAQMEANAGTNRAVAQRQAIEQRRKGRILESNLQAQAAASGASATDADVVGLAGDIGAESEYNALSNLYEGEEKARNLEGAASVRRWEGQQAKKAAKTKAISTALTSFGSMGASSMFSKYGNGGPSSTMQSLPVPGTNSTGGWSSQPYSGNKITWNTR